MSGPQPSALDGLRVIDLSRVLGGPYCSQILADHGAEVIKIEPPAGDETRGWGPPFDDAGTAWYFDGVNRNKKSVVLDLATDEGRSHLRALLATADVMIENFKPGTLERWRLGYADVLARDFPRLIHCCITGFGTDGPLGGLPGYDVVIQAMTGIMSVNGEEGGGPLRVGIPAVDMVTGLNAANGILLALVERGISGRGQSVETTLYDCGISVMHPHLPNFFGNGRNPARTGNQHPNITPYASYATGDGLLVVAVGNNPQFRTLCSHLGVPQLADDPRFIDNARRNAHRAELRDALEGALAAYRAADVAVELMQVGVPCGPINDVAGVLDHPHTAHRQMVVELDGGYRGTASPIKLSRTPPSYRLSPPRLGEHTEEILSATPHRPVER